MTTERRRFFRINDEAEISFKVITDEEFQAWEEDQTNEDDEKLNSIETELSRAMNALKTSHPQLVEVFDLLNQKIDLVMCPHSKTQGFIESGEVQPINLSACGISFHSDQPIPRDQNILLQLKLKPSNAAIITTGKVVSTDTAHGKNIIRVDFQDMSGSNQDLLMQHLFQVQGRELKKQRDKD